MKNKAKFHNRYYYKNRERLKRENAGIEICEKCGCVIYSYEHGLKHKENCKEKHNKFYHREFRRKKREEKTSK